MNGGVSNLVRETARNPGAAVLIVDGGESGRLNVRSYLAISAEIIHEPAGLEEGVLDDLFGISESCQASATRLYWAACLAVSVLLGQVLPDFDLVIVPTKVVEIGAASDMKLGWCRLPR